MRKATLAFFVILIPCSSLRALVSEVEIAFDEWSADVLVVTDAVPMDDGID